MSLVLMTGLPASREWLSKVLELQFGYPCSVTRFGTVAGTRVIGAHSSTEKISIEYASDASSFPASMYWKQIVVKDLPAKASYKLLRDVTSYRTEARFYQHFSHHLIQKGIRTPKCYYVDELFNEHDLAASQFLLLLEDLNGSSFSQQHIFLNESHTLAALDFLVALHAEFWGKSKSGNKADLALLWPKGTYWTVDKRPPDELDVLQNVWADFCGAFREASEIFREPPILALGSRLINKTPWIQETMRKCSAPLTLVHGDFKSANIFFREEPNTKAIIEVAVIDFQWSGTGFGICDVMYLILGAFNLGLWQNDFALEKKIVTYYCEKLSKRGIEYAVNDAINDFRLAALDFARVVLAYFFKSYTPQFLAVAIKDAGELTHTSSLPHIVDLLLYFDLLLSQLETHGKFVI